MTKKSRKKILGILLLVGTIVTLFVVPWMYVNAWILLLPNTVQDQVDKVIDHRLKSEISYKSTFVDKHINDDRFIFFSSQSILRGTRPKRISPEIRANRIQRNPGRI
jgi:hypothetical protein